MDLHSSTSQGLRFWLLNLGQLEADEGWFFQGANTGTRSTPNPTHARRTLTMSSVLVEHPTAGVFLYETGSTRDVDAGWGEHLCDVFNRTTFLPENHLDVAIRRTGHTIEDVTGVIIGHLHIDHAGGLEFFRGTDVPIYVHEEELSAAYMGVATRRDLGVYLPDVVDLDHNWQALTGDIVNFQPGMTLYRTPGHTPGLLGMLLETANSGNFYFSSDQFIFKEHYLEGRPMGWLMRDAAAWHRSRALVQRIEATKNAKIVFGHDPDIFAELYREEAID